MSGLQSLCVAKPTTGGMLTWHLPHRPESARAARQLTRSALDIWEVPQEKVEVALVVVSELVTNALMHALPPILLRLQSTSPDGAVRVEVSDGGPVAGGRCQEQADTADEHGRGSQIVASLAAAHGIVAEPGTGTIVRWAALRPSA
jgi:anti-sigma regulatory factor (Ser/Thr protein kinase)